MCVSCGNFMIVRPAHGLCVQCLLGEPGKVARDHLPLDEWNKAWDTKGQSEHEIKTTTKNQGASTKRLAGKLKEEESNRKKRGG